MNCADCSRWSAASLEHERTIADLTSKLSQQKLRAKAQIAQLKQSFLENLKDAPTVDIASRLEQTLIDLVESRTLVEDLQNALSEKETQLKDHMMRNRLLAEEQARVSEERIEDLAKERRSPDRRSRSPLALEQEMKQMYAQMVYKDSKVLELDNALLEKDALMADLREQLREKDELLRSKIKAVQILQAQMLSAEETVAEMISSDLPEDLRVDSKADQFVEEGGLMAKLPVLQAYVQVLQGRTADSSGRSAEKKGKKRVTFDLSEIDKQAEIDLLRERLRDAELSLDTLRTENEALHTEQEANRVTMESNAREIEALNMQVNLNFSQAQKLLEQIEEQGQEAQTKMLKLKAQHQRRVRELEEEGKRASPFDQDGIEEYKNENRTLRQRLAEMETKIDYDSEEKTKLKTEIQDLLEERASTLQAIGEMRSAVENSESAIRDLESDLLRSSQENQALRSVLSTLQQQQNAIREQLEAELSEFRNRTREYESRILQKEKEQDATKKDDGLREENNALKDRVCYLQEMLASTSEMLNAVRGSEREARDDCVKLQEKCEEADSIIAKMRNENTQYVEEIARISSELTLVKNKSEQREAELSKTQRVRDSLVEEKQDIEGELESLWNTESSLKKRLAETENINSRLAQALSDLQERCVEYEARDKESSGKIQRLLAEQAKLTKLKIRLNDELSVLKASASTQQMEVLKQALESGERFAESENERTVLRSRCGELESRNTELLRRESEIKERLEEKERRVKDLLEERRALEEEVEGRKRGFKRRVEKLKGELRALRVQCEETSAQAREWESVLRNTLKESAKIIELRCVRFVERALDTCVLESEARDEKTREQFEWVIEEHRKSLDSIRSEHEELLSSSALTDSKLVQTLGEKAELQTRLDAIESELALRSELEEDASAIRENLSALQQENRRLQEAVNESQEERKKIADERTSLCAEILNLNEDAEAKKIAIGALNESIETLCAENRDVKEMLEGKTMALFVALEKCEMMQNEIRVIKAEKEDLLSSVGALRVRMKEMEDLLLEEREKNRKSEEEVRTMSEGVRIATEEMNDVLVKVLEYEQDVKRLQNELDKEKSEAEAQIREMKNVMEERQSENTLKVSSELTVVNERMKEELDAKTEEQTQLKMAYAQLNEYYAQARESYAALYQAFEGDRSAIEEMRETLARREEEVRDRNETVKTLEARVEEAMEKIDSLNNQVKILREEAEVRSENANAQLSDAIERWERTKNELDEERRAKSEAEQSLAERERELEEKIALTSEENVRLDSMLREERSRNEVLSEQIRESSSPEELNESLEKINSLNDLVKRLREESSVQLTEAKTELHSSLERCEKLKLELETERKSKVDAEESLNALVEQENAMLHEQRILQTRLQEAMNEVSNTRLQLEQIQTEHELCGKKLEEFEARLVSSSEETLRLDSLLREERKRNEVLNEQIRESSSREELNESLEKIESLNEFVKRLEEESKQTGDELRSSMERCEQLQSELDFERKSKLSAEDSLNAFLEQQRILQAGLEDAMNEASNTRLQLEQNLAEVESKLSSAEERLVFGSEECARLDSLLREERKRNEVLSEQIRESSSREELNEAMEKIESLNSVIERLREESSLRLNEAKKELHSLIEQQEKLKSELDLERKSKLDAEESLNALVEQENAMLHEQRILQSRLHQAESDRDLQAKKLEELETNITSVQERLVSISEENTSLNDFVKRLREESADETKRAMEQCEQLQSELDFERKCKLNAEDSLNAFLDQQKTLQSGLEDAMNEASNSRLQLEQIRIERELDAKNMAQVESKLSSAQERILLESEECARLDALLREERKRNELLEERIRESTSPEDLKEAMEKIASLNDLVKNLQDESAEQASKLSSSLKRIDQLQSELDEERQSNHSLIEQERTLHSKLEEALNDASHARSQLNQADSERDLLRKKLSDIESNLTSAQEQLALSSEESTRLRKQNESLIEQLRESASIEEVATLKKAQECSAENIESLLKSEHILRSERDELLTRVGSLESEVVPLRSDLESMQARCAEIARDRDLYVGRIGGLEEELALCSNALITERSKLQESISAKRDQDEQLKQARILLESAKREREHALERIEGLEADLARGRELSEAHRRIEVEADSMRSELSTLRERCIELTNERDSHLERTRALEQELDASKREIALREKALREESSQVQHLQNMLESTKEEHLKSVSTLTQSEEIRRALTRRLLEVLQIEEDSTQDFDESVFLRIETMKAQIWALIEERRRLADALEEQRKELDAKREDEQRVFDENTKLKQRVSEGEAECEVLRQRNVSLQSRVNEAQRSSEEVLRLRSSASDLAEDVDRLSLSLQDAEKENEGLKRRMDDEKNQVDERLRVLQSENTSLKDRLSSSDSERSKYESHLHSLTQALSHAAQQADFPSNTSDPFTLINALMERFVEVRQWNQTLQLQMRESERTTGNEVLRLRMSAEEYSSELQRVLNALKEAEDGRELFKRRVDELESVRSEQVRTLNELTAVKQVLAMKEAEGASLMKEREGLQHFVSELQKANMIERESKLGFERAMHDRESECAGLRSANEELHAKMTQLSRAVNVLELKVAERDVLHEKLREAENHISRLLEDRALKEAENKKLSEQIRVQSDEIKHFRAEAEQMRLKVENTNLLDERLKFVESQLAMFSKRNAELEKDLDLERAKGSSPSDADSAHIALLESDSEVVAAYCEEEASLWSGITHWCSGVFDPTAYCGGGLLDFLTLPFLSDM